MKINYALKKQKKLKNHNRIVENLNLRENQMAKLCTDQQILPEH